MPYISDAIIYDSKRNPVLIVEVKSKLGTNAQWAAAMRRNMQTHGLLLDAPFFLLALPDRLYLWVNDEQTGLTKPDYEIDTKSTLESYSKYLKLELENLSESGFELLLTSWLRELINGTELVNEANEWLVESGLLEAIKQGDLLFEVIR